MEGFVPKDRPGGHNRTLGDPRPQPRERGSAEGDRKAQELGDLYFAADNFAVALEYYRRALEVEDRRGEGASQESLLKTGTQIVECLRHRGDLNEAVEALHDLHRKLRPHVTREQIGRLSSRLGILLFERGRYRAAHRAASRAYRLLRDTTLNLDLGHTEMCLGAIALRTGEWNSAREHFESAIATYRRADYQSGMAAAYNNLGLLHKNQCRFKESVRFLEQALRISERSGHYHDAATYVHNLGIVHDKMGDWDLAEEHYRRGLQMYTEVGYAAGRARALGCLGNLKRKRRDWAQAEELIRESLALATERGYPRETILAREALGDYFLDRGALLEARGEFESALTMADQVAPDSDLTVELLRRLGEVHLAALELDPAVRLAERALAIARRLGDRLEEACSLKLIGLASAEAGDLEQARGYLDQASEILQQIGKRYELARLCFAAGLAWRKRARRGKSRAILDESVSYLRRAVAGFESFGLSELTAGALLELSRSEMHRGLTDEAVIHLDHAASLFSDREEPALEHEIEEFRREVEQGLIEGTSAQSNEFAAFDEIRRVLRVEEGDGSLQEILGTLVRRSGAARGCVVAPASDGSATVLAAAGISLRVAQDLLRELLARLGAERLGSGPVVSSRAGVDPRFRDFPASHALSPRTSLVIMPLSLPSGQAGFLYLDRPAEGPLGAFKQREVNLIAVLSNYVSVAILETQRRELARENLSLRGRLLGTADDHGIITRSRELLEILSLLERVGPSDATILIEGETGSGKGLLARAIHASSNRANKPLIQVNCAALPEPLLESELFGHVQGAFTGAVREKSGLFVEANGGTLFLDEVDKTTITIQGKLLQVLDNREVRPVGGNRSTKVDVRVLCATNVNLKARIAKGEFLEDLYYRLNDICFRVPPLRERPEDIPLLVEHYLQRFAAEMGKDIRGVDPEVLRLFAELPWRGNVRELEKVAKRMVVLANDGEPLSVRLVPRELLRVEEEASDSPATLKAEVAKVERKLIGQALERSGWNKLRAARALSLSYPTLLQKIKLYQLDRRQVIRQRS
ncbi:MAG: tetratricopeptide repeat protein [Candidatus Eisenbacteria bacterium]|uniref:Tetratricopeptide repeat protein n=1 Tax=Eiseniibacteriota bacterium TaxID=2212470 RepID=A0A538TBA5_UNCEI|nr:MAG: tetratricopeptide repeat protein [Candidatus Eisenbacteria bacterium]